MNAFSDSIAQRPNLARRVVAGLTLVFVAFLFFGYLDHEQFLYESGDYIPGNDQECEQKQQYFLTVFVLSGQENSELRNSIRQTWGSATPDFVNVGIVFAIDPPTISDGQDTENEKLAWEFSTHHDLMIPYPESPSKISTENNVDSIISIVEWYAENVCSEFILFVDDNTFVNVVSLVNYLFSREPSNLLIQGTSDNSESPSFLVTDNVAKAILTQKEQILRERFKILDDSLVYETIGSKVKTEKDPRFCSGDMAIDDLSFCNPNLPQMYFVRGKCDRFGMHYTQQQLEETPRDNGVKLQQIENLQRDVTVAIKHTSMYRRAELGELILSIRKYYPKIKIIIGDDSPLDVSHQCFPDNDLNKILHLPPDSGLSYGRNAIVESVETKYVLLLDDDNIFWANTTIEDFYEILETDLSIHLVGGTYVDIIGNFEFQKPYSYALDLEYDESNWLNFYYTAKQKGEYGHSCRKTHSTHNFFMARTDALLKSPWRPELKMNEHEFFFLDFTSKNYGIVECPEVTVLHSRYHRSKAYAGSSRRYTQYCPAFRMLCDEYNQYDGFLTPWMEVNCERKFVCALVGASNRETQLNTQDTDWEDDPLRREKCMKFSSPNCHPDAHPGAVNHEAHNNKILIKNRRKRPSQRQKETRHKRRTKP